jgi:hypothetical protein
MRSAESGWKEMSVAARDLQNPFPPPPAPAGKIQKIATEHELDYNPERMPHLEMRDRAGPRATLSLQEKR